ncbi:hypothetical protein M3Y98_00886600 [Aphelenchoides besseyi]|nr:hypothetical protein M3Y98_00886600 [Aphelenchoides besseyi]KAI6192951.1 hypothetical protein M3Y96_00966800 [Aphelenchoides besseyi]
MEFKSVESKREILRWVVRTLECGVQDLREEFRQIQQHYAASMDAHLTTVETKEMAAVWWEMGRNRYKDVPCQPAYRVRLRRHNGYIHPDDYIHANYVSTPTNSKRFICTQGPLETTITDFWFMVVQEQVENIVMLCNCREKGYEKCAHYWPTDANQTLRFGDFEVTNTAIRPLNFDEPSVCVTSLQVRWSTSDGEKMKRQVQHYQWISWPDRGVPPCNSIPLLLLDEVRESTKPIVVHCSAGIGRSGTIVAVEFIFERFNSGLSCSEMPALVGELRKMRAYAIQTAIQYLFLHRLLLFFFFEVHKSDEPFSEELQKKYRQFVNDYDQFTQE